MGKRDFYLSIYIINSANVSVCMSLCGSVCVSESIYLQDQSVDILQILWRDMSNIRILQVKVTAGSKAKFTFSAMPINF